MPNPAQNEQYAQLFAELGQVNLSVEMKIDLEEVILYSEEIEQLRDIVAELEEPDEICQTAYFC